LGVRFWVMCWCERRYEKYFALDCEMALPQGYAGRWPKMTDAEITSFKAKAREAVTQSAGISSTILPMVRDAFQRGKSWK
jgi:hypothetical protein